MVKQPKTSQKGPADDQERPCAGNVLARTELMLVICEEIQRRAWTQTEAAKYLGVGQPRVSDLIQGHVDRFSVDMLLIWLEKLGKEVCIAIKPNLFDYDGNVRLTLYMLGTRDDVALAAVSKLFAGDSTKYELTVVNVLESPQLAADAKIKSTPCLVREWPLPKLTLVGDLSAASIRWQLEIAQRDALENAQVSHDLREAKLDRRESDLDLRELRIQTSESD
jgi:predicted XRE-type DNA-binding protein